MLVLVYMKIPLSLLGSAEEIYLRASKIIEIMIKEIISLRPTPNELEGEIVEFKRRNPDQSELKSHISIEKLYDYIRMLDAEGYPPAFLKWDKYRLEFARA